LKDFLVEANIIEMGKLSYRKLHQHISLLSNEKTLRQRRQQKLGRIEPVVNKAYLTDVENVMSERHQLSLKFRHTLNELITNKMQIDDIAEDVQEVLFAWIEKSPATIAI
tara:strand:+ start:546 stop:875 length:330 start_codon:yes stop_codon:yes gene_type:complete